IGIEAGAIIGLCDFEAVLVIVCERPRITVEVIEDAEFHLPSAFQWPGRATLLLQLHLLSSLRQGAQPQRIYPHESLRVAVIIRDLSFLERDEILVVERIG